MIETLGVIAVILVIGKIMLWKHQLRIAPKDIQEDLDAAYDAYYGLDEADEDIYRDAVKDD